MLSLTNVTQYHQSNLLQGIGMVLGVGMLLLPMISLQAHNWKPHRALVIGIILAGPSWFISIPDHGTIVCSASFCGGSYTRSCSTSSSTRALAVRGLCAQPPYSHLACYALLNVDFQMRTIARQPPCRASKASSGTRHTFSQALSRMILHRHLPSALVQLIRLQSSMWARFWATTPRPARRLVREDQPDLYGVYREHRAAVFPVRSQVRSRGHCVRDSVRRFLRGSYIVAPSLTCCRGALAVRTRMRYALDMSSALRSEDQSATLRTSPAMPTNSIADGGHY